TIGFFGGATRLNGSMTPTYTMLFAGSAQAGELGKAVMRVPAKRVISTVLKIIELYRAERSEGQTLRQWVAQAAAGPGPRTGNNLETLPPAAAPPVPLAPAAGDPAAGPDYGAAAGSVAKPARGGWAARPLPPQHRPHQKCSPCRSSAPLIRRGVL